MISRPQSGASTGYTIIDPRYDKFMDLTPPENTSVNPYGISSTNVLMINGGKQNNLPIDNVDKPLNAMIWWELPASLNFWEGSGLATVVPEANRPPNGGPVYVPCYWHNPRHITNTNRIICNNYNKLSDNSYTLHPNGSDIGNSGKKTGITLYGPNSLNEGLFQSTAYIHISFATPIVNKEPVNIELLKNPVAGVTSHYDLNPLTFTIPSPPIVVAGEGHHHTVAFVTTGIYYRIAYEQSYTITATSTDDVYNNLTDTVTVRIGPRAFEPPPGDREIVEGQANNINGFWPVYDTPDAAAAAASDGRVVDLGYGYFMPNQVTNSQIYLGNAPDSLGANDGVTQENGGSSSGGNALADGSNTVNQQ